MSKVVRILPLRTTISGRWQIPLLCGGVALLGGGLARTVMGHQVTTLADEVAIVERLKDENQLSRANAYLVRKLSDLERPPLERARLHRELAETIHTGESRLSVHSPTNVRSILSNYRAAGQLGGEPSAEDWVRMGDAYRWAHEDGEAVDAYRQALLTPPRRPERFSPDRIRRQIVELRISFGGTLSGDGVDELDQIIADDSASPLNYLWAVEQKSRWLLDQDDPDAALALATEAQKRLAGSGANIAVRFIEALCLFRSGQADDAELILRSLRNDWTIRDELWGKSGWLLGVIQQRDDRPQSGLAFFDEVLRSFEAGDLHDACLFGRAECLAALGRHAPALEAYAELNDRLLAARRHDYLDKGVVRAALTARGGELLGPSKNDGILPPDRQKAIAYLRMALELVSPEDVETQIPYLSRIAAGLSVLADAMSSPDAPAEDLTRVTRLYEEAGATYSRLAQVQQGAADTSSGSAWLAIECYAKAGRRKRVIEMLEEFVAERPTSLLQSRALHRLGLAYQAEHRNADAVRSFETVIKEFEGLPDALASFVPLAECRINLGGKSEKAGVDLLLDIVDDRAGKQWLTPKATEYREALILLANYYAVARTDAVEGHFERAVERLEDALVLYPDDPRVPELTFLLADAFRQSAIALRKGRESSETATDSVAEAADTRLAAALRHFSAVVQALAPHNEGTNSTRRLSGLEKTFLRMSYLYRGDCLFDLGRYDDAIAAYEEAAWRYDNMPAAVSASMQIYHCQQRLGRTGEARAVLGRLHWLIQTIPETAFEAERGMPKKAYWEALIDRLDRLNVTGVSLAPSAPRSEDTSVAVV